MPEALVVTVALPVNVPLAPDTGAAKVTETPLTGLLLASRTVACSAVANALPTVALCGVPGGARSEGRAPAVVRQEKFGGRPDPAHARRYRVAARRGIGGERRSSGDAGS